MHAIRSMLKMFSFEVQLKGGNDVKCPPNETGMINNENEQDNGQATDHDHDQEQHHPEEDLDNIDDIRLPTWAFSSFANIQNAETSGERVQMLRDLSKSMGGPERLREIRRVYQWVSLYATWRHPSHEQMLFDNEIHDDEDAAANKYRSKLALSASIKLHSPGKNTKLISGSATRDKAHLKASTPKFQRGNKTDTGKVSRNRRSPNTKTPTAEKKLARMMQEYSTFYDTYNKKAPLDWRP